MSPSNTDITGLLVRIQEGDADAPAALFPLLYEELHSLAKRQRQKQGASETLNTTALVHETYERLASSQIEWENRRHFFLVAARAMRAVLVDDARARAAIKRGGDFIRVSLEEMELASQIRTDDMLALDEAIGRLSQLDARQEEIVELRFFVGLTIAETADILDLSVSTVKREWIMARAWLQQELQRAA